MRAGLGRNNAVLGDLNASGTAAEDSTAVTQRQRTVGHCRSHCWSEGCLLSIPVIDVYAREETVATSSSVASGTQKSLACALESILILRPAGWDAVPLE